MATKAKTDGAQALKQLTYLASALKINSGYPEPVGPVTRIAPYGWAIAWRSLPISASRMPSASSSIATTLATIRCGSISIS